MKTIETQVIIIGGGIVGLVLAKALSSANISVVLIESKPPALEWDSESLDPKVSAINLASQKILTELNIWSLLPENSYAPIRRLMVWDDLGGGEISFDCNEIGKAQCAYVLENRELIKHLWLDLQTNPLVQFLGSENPQQLWRSHSQVQLVTEHHHIFAPLLVGADGGRSWVRSQMTTAVKQHDYQQQAIIAIVKTENPHQATAWQNFLATGPLALLPLADQHHSAMIWSTTELEAKRLLALRTESLNHEIANALNQKLGSVTVLSDCSAFPLVMRHANDYVGERIALAGDAAHSIHPLAGQGVNLGIMDARALADIIISAHRQQQDIGNFKLLGRYQRQRKSDNCLMEVSMTLFNQVFNQTNPMFIALRSQGLNFTNKMGFLKNRIMRYAMGKC